MKANTDELDSLFIYVHFINYSLCVSDLLISVVKVLIFFIIKHGLCYKTA